MGQKQSSPLNLPEGGETPFINQDLFAKLHEHTNKVSPIISIFMI